MAIITMGPDAGQKLIKYEIFLLHGTRKKIATIDAIDFETAIEAVSDAAREILVNGIVAYPALVKCPNCHRTYGVDELVDDLCPECARIAKKKAI